LEVHRIGHSKHGRKKEGKKGGKAYHRRDIGASEVALCRKRSGQAEKSERAGRIKNL